MKDIGAIIREKRGERAAVLAEQPLSRFRSTKQAREDARRARQLRGLRKPGRR